MSEVAGRIGIWAIALFVLGTLQGVELQGSVSDSVERDKIGEWSTYSGEIPWITTGSDKKGEIAPVMTRESSRQGSAELYQGSTSGYEVFLIIIILGVAAIFLASFLERQI